MKHKEEFTKAYDTYAAPILRHITFRVSNEAIAQDLTQETFFRAWRFISSKNGAIKIKSFKAFLYRIANNLVIDYYRKKKETISLEDIQEKELIVQARQEEEVEARIEKAAMEKHLDELKDEYRQILLYRYVDDLSVSEISEIIGKTKDNVSVTIHRALKSLRKQME